MVSKKAGKKGAAKKVKAAKSSDNVKALQAELKRAQADYHALHKEFEHQLGLACELAYDQGFNTALNELERFTAARDNHCFSVKRQSQSNTTMLTTSEMPEKKKICQPPAPCKKLNAAP